MSFRLISTKLSTAARAGHWVWICYLDCLYLGSSDSDVESRGGSNMAPTQAEMLLSTERLWILSVP